MLFLTRLILIPAIFAVVLGVSRAEDVVSIKREDTEWLEFSIPGLHKKTARVSSLIGDSIVGGYFWQVTEKLGPEAYVARLSTSKSLGDPGLLEEIAYVLGHAAFEVVHFNNGLHGRDYTEEEYRKAFPELLEVLRKGAPKAKLIWAATTPTREGKDFATVSAFTERVRARNVIAAELVADAKIPVNDLFGLVLNHAEYFGDGTHFNAEGYERIAAQVAERIRQALGR